MLESPEHVVFGEVVTISVGGMRVKSPMYYLYDIETTIDFSLSFGGGQFLVVGAGKVIYIRPGEVEIQFLQNPMGIRGLLDRLEKEHFPWSSSLQD